MAVSECIQMSAGEKIDEIQVVQAWVFEIAGKP
jgi:hypothetical protein